MNSVYIATSKAAIAVHNILRNLLAKADIPQSYDWTVEGLQDTAEAHKQIASKCIKGVIDANLVIVLLPGGRGTHVELGAALALMKPILLYGDISWRKDTKASAFYWHPDITFVDENLGLQELVALSCAFLQQ